MELRGGILPPATRRLAPETGQDACEYLRGAPPPCLSDRFRAKKMAERQGFEPWLPFGKQHFQCCSIDHSDTSPRQETAHKINDIRVFSRKKSQVARRPPCFLPCAHCPQLSFSVASGAFTGCGSHCFALHYPAMPDDVRISVEGLEVGFRHGRRILPVVDGVSLELRGGEMLALLGESGSGKSMTALSLLGLLPRPAGCLTGGSAWYHGEDIYHVSEESLRKLRGRRIAMIFQERAEPRPDNRRPAPRSPFHTLWHGATGGGRTCGAPFARGGNPRGGEPSGVIPASAFGRIAPACHDCDGAGWRTGDNRRR